MAQFMLLLRSRIEQHETYTPEEMQANLRQYRDWAIKLSKQGKLMDGKKLKDSGTYIVNKGGTQLVVDGPFAETKEAIGGYFLIQARDYDEAMSIARHSPIFNENGSVEIRQIEAPSGDLPCHT